MFITLLSCSTPSDPTQLCLCSSISIFSTFPGLPTQLYQSASQPSAVSDFVLPKARSDQCTELCVSLCLYIYWCGQMTIRVRAETTKFIPLVMSFVSEHNSLKVKSAGIKEPIHQGPLILHHCHVKAT